MKSNKTDIYNQPLMERGFSGKDYITMNIQGKPVKVPLSQLDITPPKGGTAAVTLKKK
ncbi:hypothetical protein Holit_00270 [Hollandina sp. SP2]